MNLNARQLISLLLASLVGGYLFATSAGLALAALLPLPKAEAVLSAILFSFLCWLLLTLWLFHQRQPARAWLTITILSLLCYGVYWLAR